MTPRPQTRMRICLYSNVFLPSVGGYQQVSATLARGFNEAGHPTTLVTPTPAPDDYDQQFSFPVVRGPLRRADWQAILAGHDVVVSNGASAKHLFTWLRGGRPVVYIHGTYLRKEPKDADSLLEWAHLSFVWATRRRLLRLASSHVYYSRAMREIIGLEPGEVIYNPVDPMFRPMPDVAREASYGFFGRLIEDKGVGTLLDALALLNQRGLRRTLDIYGEGTFEAAARRRAETLGIADQVRFQGFRRGEQVVRAMNAVDVVVVPSLWREPLGMVAVEAMACGKCVIGSEGGGLGEVIGPHGLTFPNGDAEALAKVMSELDRQPELKARLERDALDYARQFTPALVIERYVAHLSQVIAQHAASAKRR